MKEKEIKRALLVLIGVSTVLRSLFALVTELGNDEVYYWTYALYPDLSHFDHPPMVGFIIQLFSLNLLFDSEIFLRLGSIVLGSVNTWLIYVIGKQIKNPITGFYASLLYTSSIYCFIVAGIFILPDTPQLFFWLVSLYFMIRSLTGLAFDVKSKKYFLLMGLSIGLAMLSKYTSIFLWVGVFTYILLYDKKWLKSKFFYLSVFISLIIFSPVLWWNIQNEFISLTFQGGRVSFIGGSLRFDFLFSEILGTFLYNNPVNVTIVIISLIAIYRKKQILSKPHLRILLLTGLPLIILFIGFSFFRRTLPHWTGPAHMTLLLAGSAYLSETKIKNGIKLVPGVIKYGLILLVLTMLIGYLQISYGLINFYDPNNTKPTELGNKDISLDLYGWEQINTEFTKILNDDFENNIMGDDPAIITYRWFPAANLDYYVARPNQLRVLTIGSLDATHKYSWINNKRGGYQLGMNAYYITTSRDYLNPERIYSNIFISIESADTIRITKGGKHVMNVFVYRMKYLKRIPNTIIKQL